MISRIEIKRVTPVTVKQIDMIATSFFGLTYVGDIMHIEFGLVPRNVGGSTEILKQVSNASSISFTKIASHEKDPSILLISFLFPTIVGVPLSMNAPSMYIFWHCTNKITPLS